MPQTHESKEIRDINFDRFKLDGRVYTAKEDGVEFSLWSLVDKGDAENGPATLGSYEDACADLVWESLLKPYRDELPKEVRPESHMSYDHELLLDNLPRGREYAVKLGGRPGLARFFVADRQIYVLVVLNLEPQNVSAGVRFIYSFGPKKPDPPDTSIGFGRRDGLGVGRGSGIGPGQGGGNGPGQGGGNMGGGDRVLPGGPPSVPDGPTDYNRVFSGKDVTQKARILSKPEPQYTESARKYSVKGTVILRAVFSRTGEVSQIRAVQGLPHGLTIRAIVAARNIKFTPAQKDGHDVSMWFQLEYNFNLY
jgi:TonB family protein